jgi:GNAT superfamily N-acetyltransferase
MPVEIRFATPADLEWCTAHEHIAAPLIARKIPHDEIIIAELAGQRIGLLRLEFLWSMVPYIALIRVLDPFQQQGAGRALLAFAETQLRAQGHGVLMSSSQVDEAPPQAWHRHMGFVECGILSGINDGGVGEVFFRKTL